MKKSKKAGSKKKKEGGIAAGWIFLTLVLMMYLVSYIVNRPLFEQSVSYFSELSEKMMPTLCLVLTLMYITHLFLNPQNIKKYIGKDSGLRGWSIAIAGGIISSGPAYVWYPMLESLKKKGTRVSLIAAFMYARSIKLPLLPVMVYYFGLSFTAILTFYILLFSVISGTIVEKLSPDSD